MTLALEVITDVLEDLIVQEDEAPIQASDANGAIRYMNDLMAQWEADGISLGYTTVTDLGDTITIPAGAIKGLKANLVIELAGKHDVEVTQTMLIRAKNGYNTCVTLALELDASAFPSTLPVGSGNESAGVIFYPEPDEEEEEETTTTTVSTNVVGSSTHYINESVYFTLTSSYSAYLILCDSTVDQRVYLDNYTIVNDNLAATIMKVSTGDVTISLPTGITGITWGDDSTGNITIKSLGVPFELTYNYELNKIYFNYTGAYDQS